MKIGNREFFPNWPGILLITVLVILFVLSDGKSPLKEETRTLITTPFEKQVEYCVVYNRNPREFVFYVNERIRNGWIAIGNVSVEYPVNEDRQFHQAMVRLETE